jgi:hypothetical protein
MVKTRDAQMKQRLAIFAIVVVTAACNSVPVAAQTESVSGEERIQVTDPRPLAAALEVLEKKHGLAITYEDTVYSAPSDISDAAIQPVTGKIVRIHVPKGGTFNFKYMTENGAPKEDSQALLRRMLTEYGDLGNPTFTLQEHVFERGPRWHFPDNLHLSEWHVIPVKMRDKNGQLVQQPALLDNIVSVQQQRGTSGRALGEICQQLTALSGHEVMIGSMPLNYLANPQYQNDFGATNKPAREVLADLLGPSMVWKLFYDPEKDRYIFSIHIAALPPRTTAVAPPASNSDPHSSHSFSSLSGMSDPAHPVSREEAYKHMSAAAARHYTLPKEQISQIQSVLANAGFYHGEPTRTWDSNTMEAMRNFQSANSLPPTGRWDGPTLQRLGVTVTPSARQGTPPTQP